MESRTSTNTVILFALSSIWASVVATSTELSTSTSTIRSMTSPSTSETNSSSETPPSTSASLRCPDPVGFNDGTIKYRLRDIYLRGRSDPGQSEHVPSVFKVFGIRCAASFEGRMAVANLQPSTKEAMIYFNRSIESIKAERYYRAMSVEEGNVCEYKYRQATTSSTFCYTKKASEKRCFRESITISDVAVGDVFSDDRQSDCPNEITLTGTEEEKVYVDQSENLYPLAVFCFLGTFVLVLTIIAGIQFRRSHSVSITKWYFADRDSAGMKAV